VTLFSGDGGLSAELCADPWPSFGRAESSFSLVCFGGAASCGTLPWHSFDRGRDRHADACRQTVHTQSTPCHHLARVLVLVVGCPGAILSFPMLAIAKIVCDRVKSLAAFGHFPEG
jgi:hypothetical protein